MKDSVLAISLIGVGMVTVGMLGTGVPLWFTFLGVLGVAFGATWAIAGAAARDQQ